jgi:vacuolar protein sorting-associated protein 16
MSQSSSSGQRLQARHCMTHTTTLQYTLVTQNKNPKAEENIKHIKSQLAFAVDACIDAASNELDTQVQKSLLRAATFGKSFLIAYPALKFTDMAKHLRILNSCRAYTVGIPLTYLQ